jgi:hypothetical protein
MTKEEYATKAMQLAAKCKVFAEETCREWSVEAPGAEVPDDATAWEGLGEFKDLYLTLETLKAKADLLFNRAISLRRFWIRPWA